MDGGEEAEDALVDGTREEELEVGVVTESHVCPVLMAEHLEDYGWELRVACLAIVAVPHLAAVPCPQFAGQVFADLCHHHVSQVAAHQPREVRCCPAFIEACRIDAEGAHQRVVGTEPGIAMQSHAEFDGHTKAAVAPKVVAAFGKEVFCEGA